MQKIRKLHPSKILRSCLLVFFSFALSLNTAIPAFADDPGRGYSHNGINWFNISPPSSEGGQCTTGGGGTAGSTGPSLDGFALPASKGTTGGEEPINESGQVPSSGGRVTFSQFAKLGQEYRDYYINMRWTYAAWNWNGTAKIVDNKQFSWMDQKPRLVLVTNPRNGKSIIAAILESGPAPWVGADNGPNNNPKQGWTNPQVGTPPTYTGIVSGFPPTAIKALDAITGYLGQKGDQLTYAWAADQNAKPGPVGGGVAPGTGGVASTTACGGGGGSDIITGPQGSVPTVYYSQYDPRWAQTQVGGRTTVARSGCGITSMAMIISTFKNDPSITPNTMAKLWDQNGWMTSEGTSWAAFDGAAKAYGLKSEEVRAGGSVTTGDLQKVAEAVRAGKLVVATGTCAGCGLFTTAGHIVVIRGITAAGKFLVNDPKDKADVKKSTNTEWDPSVFTTNSYGLWIISK